MGVRSPLATAATMAADAFTASLASFISGRLNQTGRSLRAGASRSAESQGWTVAVLRHFYGLLDQLLGIVLEQFIEKNCGRIPASLGLAARISAPAFRKFCHVSKPEFALNFSETVLELLPGPSAKLRLRKLEAAKFL